MNFSPYGKFFSMKICIAAFILSGHKALITHSLWKYTLSSFLQSEGSFAVSGVRSLNQSLNQPGSSFSTESGSFSNSSISPSHCKLNHAWFGNQSFNVFATSVFGTQFSKKFIIFGVHSVLMMFFCKSLKARRVKKICLCFSKRPHEIH